MKKKEKCLCDNCDQKWSSAHKFKSKFLLLLGTEDDDQDNDLLPMEPSLSLESPTEEPITGDISSFHALAG